MSAEWLTGAEKARVEAIVSAGAAGAEAKPEHWIHDWDEGVSFCRSCAEAKIKELLAEEPGAGYCLAGGWGIEGDRQAFCETCEELLDNTYTMYACESEVDHFLENGFFATDAVECHSLNQVISSEGWGPYEELPGSDFERKRRREYYVALHELGRRILTNAGKEGA